MLTEFGSAPNQNCQLEPGLLRADCPVLAGPLHQFVSDTGATPSCAPATGEVTGRPLANCTSACATCALSESAPGLRGRPFTKALAFSKCWLARAGRPLPASEDAHINSVDTFVLTFVKGSYPGYFEKMLSAF